MVFQQAVKPVVVSGPEAFKIEEGITEALGIAGYLADHWDPRDVELHRQLRINTERIRQAALRGDLRTVLNVVLDSENLHNRWEKGNGREDSDHRETIKALLPVMEILERKEPRALAR